MIAVATTLDGAATPRIILLEANTPDVSSTEIRRRARARRIASTAWCRRSRCVHRGHLLYRSYVAPSTRRTVAPDRAPGSSSLAWRSHPHRPRHADNRAPSKAASAGRIDDGARGRARQEGDRHRRARSAQDRRVHRLLLDLHRRRIRARCTPLPMRSSRRSKRRRCGPRTSKATSAPSGCCVDYFDFVVHVFSPRRAAVLRPRAAVGQRRALSNCPTRTAARTPARA